MNNEIAALEANHTWDITTLPPDKRAISSKWVYKIKFKPDGSIERFKARFIVRGFNQIKDKDFKRTFSLIAKLPTVRVRIALATTKGWPIHQLDINNAFLHGTLDEEVYIIPPEGYEKAKGKVCKLNKSLYGLKQASRQWNKEFTQFLLRNGFSQSKQDYSLFTKGKMDSQSFLAILVYVDDVLITGENPTQINDLKNKIHEAFTIKDLGPIKYFFGIEVSRTIDGTTLHQRKYILDILQDLGLSACKSTAFPLPTNLKLSTDNGDLLPHREQYRRLIGRLLYLSITRPDISYAVQHLSQFVSSPRQPHMNAALHLARYLKGTINVGLFYPSNNTLDLYAYTNADWG